MKNIPIGEVLKEYGYITEEQIQEALSYQKQNRDKRLGAIVIELGFVTEGQMVEALAKRLELSVVDLTNFAVDINAVDSIPRQVAQRHLVIAVAQTGGRLTIVMNDPLNFYAIEDIRQMTQMPIDIMLDVSEHIQAAIEHYYTQLATREAFKKADAAAATTEMQQLEVMEDTGDDAPIVQALNSLLLQGYNIGASDIHVEPFEEYLQVRMRVDGVVTETAKLSKSLQLSLLARIKILANMDIAERRLPQDGHFHIVIDGVDINTRVSMIPTIYGEKAVIRFLYTNVLVDNESTFGMTKDNYEKFTTMLASPHGLIYITGPTGSGKTTTLYMVLEKVARGAINVSTIEDPVERNLPQVNQVQVNNVAGLTFESGLRALLRQDPDIIMVGETRDSETAAISVRAAITGHQVFSTLHTNDALSSIVRLRDMGIPSYLVANSLVGLIAQRLVRKICPYCAETHEASDSELHALGVQSATIKKGKGCDRCNNTGYSGRRSIHEVVLLDKEMRRMITAEAEMETIEQYVIEKQNFTSLYIAARDLVLEGVTTMEEFYKIAYYSD